MIYRMKKHIDLPLTIAGIGMESLSGFLQNCLQFKFVVEKLIIPLFFEKYYKDCSGKKSI